MAAIALGRAPEDEMEEAFQALTIHLRDRDPELSVAVQDSLRRLARRRPALPTRMLDLLGPEELWRRVFLARILFELEQGGSAEARTALETHLAGELDCGVEERVTAARRLQRERARAAGGRAVEPPP